MKKFYLSFALFTSLFILPNNSHAGQINLSTYYPAPLGNYDRLRFVQQTAPITCDASVEGLVIYDNNSQLTLCDNTGTWSVIGGTSVNPWAQNTNNIYPTDTSTNPNLLIGIGTTNPEFKLTLEKGAATPDGGILSIGTFSSGLTLSTSGAGTRLIWYPKKAAFRAGDVSGTQWNDNSIGDASIALGSDTTASGAASTAMGSSTTASGVFSTAMGSNTIASGDTSTAMGQNTTASGASSTAMGDGSLASNSGATAIGLSATANKSAATAIGFSVTASGTSALATGSFTTASGDTSTAMGFVTTASGRSSTSIGQYTTAQSYVSTVLGSYNIISAGSATAWFATDPLFVIGNGTADASRSNAMTVLKNGNVGIGTTTPEFKLFLDNDGGIIAKGTYGDPAATTLPDLDAGTRMVWYPKKAAFRVGTLTAVGATYWNNSNVGDVSVAMGMDTVAQGQISTAIGYLTNASGNGSTAMGYATKANGDYSTAMGADTTASGTISTAMGNQTTASGDSSTAMGYTTTANGDNSTAMGSGTTADGDYSIAMGTNTTTSGNYSTAMGANTTASGDYSIAMGLRTTAQPYLSVVLGRWNISSGNTGAWIPSDPIFIIGNGTNGSTKSNAFEVLKNGTVKVSGTTVHSSDRRLKKNILPITGTLEKLNQINGVNYEWISKNKPSGLKLGVIAQDVEKVYPELVSQDPITGMKSVNYNGLIAPLIEAVKELHAENELLKKRIENLENK